MLYRLLHYLFRDDMFYRYTPRPGHLFYAVLLLGVGTVTAGYGYVAFGVTTFILGVGLGVTVLVGMTWDKVIEYWQKVDSVVDNVIKIKDVTLRYEILKSLGYAVTPSRVEIVETTRDENGTFVSNRIQRLPVSAAILQRIADKALYSGNLDFTEQLYGSVVPSFRKVKQQLKEAGYIVPKNNKNVRLGYMFNRKGVDVLYEHASPGVKLDLKRKEG